MPADWQFSPRRNSDGSITASVALPVPNGPLVVSLRGKHRRQALLRAATAAKAIANNPALAAILPPGSGQAVSAIIDIASSPEAATLAKYTGKGAKRLFKSLRKVF